MFPPEAQRSAPPLALSGLIINGRLVQQTARGEIRIIRNGQSLSPLYAGFPLEKGDQISTAQNAEAVIGFEYGIRAYLARIFHECRRAPYCDSFPAKY